jgi:predicted subunit of tRNA(5-methylaminomethyl-2-thiouridylate) methyltransferase
MKNPSISIAAVTELENRLRSDYFKALYGGMLKLSNRLSEEYTQVSQYRRALERGETPPMPKVISFHLTI